MKLSEYRDSSSWQGAIELGPKLMQLAEELPGSEEMGLSLQLRQLMVELPATIAADLLRPAGSDVRLLPVLKLLATLELIDKVYPALDTAGVRGEADTLAERLMSTEQFTAAPAPKAAAEPEKSAAAPAETPVLPSEVPEPTPEPATPTSVTITPEPATITPEPATSVAVTPAPATAEEPDVHPDSVQ